MSGTFNRGTGLLVINVVNSNPNGDPDAESEPRTFEGDMRGLISPVSFKRKLRDLMENQTGTVRAAALAAVGPASQGCSTLWIDEVDEAIDAGECGAVAVLGERAGGVGFENVEGEGAQAREDAGVGADA